MGNTSKTSNIVSTTLAFVGGVATGLAVGLLMAPKAGEELRAEIGETVEGYVDTAKQKAADLQSSMSNMAKVGLTEVQRVKDEVVDKVNEKVSSAINDGVSTAHSVVDKTASAVKSGAEKGQQAADSAINKAADAART